MKLNIIQKQVHRNILFIILIIIFFVLGMLTRSAYADEPKGKKISSEPIPPRPEFKPNVLVTTTTQVEIIQAKVAVIPEEGLSQVVEVPVDVRDWVTQCKEWATMAGIELPPSAITLLDRESDCDPTIRNPNSSAGGIPQALPYTKMGCLLEYSDEAAICQLQWFHGYVMQRYGSWDNALAHSSNYGWY